MPVHPLGSNRTCANLSTRNLIGTPYCKLKLTAVAKASISPEIVDPSFAIVMKISPGKPSSYIPTVMYPSWPPIENLCVIERRSSGNLRRMGRYTTFSTIAGGAAATAPDAVAPLGAVVPAFFSPLPEPELSGCTFLELSR